MENENIRKIREIIQGMTTEEQAAVAGELPTTVLAGELWGRMLDLTEFKKEFDNLVVRTSRLGPQMDQ